MTTKTELKKYLSFPVFLISSGSFVGLVGWWGLAQTAGGIIFFIGSMLLSLSGSVTALWGLMSLERTEPSPTKIRKLKNGISKDLKIQYPSYILQVENLKRKTDELHNQLPYYRSYFENFKNNIRQLRTELISLEEQLQNNLKKNAPVIDNDSAEGIAKKILWSEKQIYLTQLSDSLEDLSEFFTSSDLEKYRVELTSMNGRFSQLERGTDLYRDLMMLCHKADSEYENVLTLKQKVDDINRLMLHHKPKLSELETMIERKYEESKIALLDFRKQIDDFEEDIEH